MLTLKRFLTIIRNEIRNNWLFILVLTLAFLAIIVLSYQFAMWTEINNRIKIAPKIISFKKVLLHNMAASLFQELMGIATFGIYGILDLFVNALALGATFRVLNYTNQMYLIYKILIHGSIESSGIILGAFFSIRFWIKLFTNIKLTFLKRVKVIDSLKDMANFVVAFNLLFIFMYIIAAICEKIISYI